MSSEPPNDPDIETELNQMWDGIVKDIVAIEPGMSPLRFGADKLTKQCVRGGVRTSIKLLTSKFRADTFLS
jgi:hypothetical protein